MKIKCLFMAATAAWALASCSQEDMPGNPQTGYQGESAYLAITVLNAPTSKFKAIENVDKPGSEGESKASDVKVLCFDEYNKCLGVVDFSGTTVGGSAGNGTPVASESSAKLVPAKTKKIFVVINNNSSLWDLTTAKDKSWSEINATATSAATTAAIATNEKFVMVNEGSTNTGALIDVSSNLKEDATAAKNNAATINVDRLAAKVTLTQNSGMTVTPTNSKFGFLGWELNTVNKGVSIYTEKIQYPNAATSARPAFYRIDHNYSGLTADEKNDPTYLNANYTWLKNGTQLSELSPVTLALDKDTYCPENTMAAASQLWGHTTKIVVRAYYTPASLVGADWDTNKPSYFAWNGNYYTLAQIKDAFKTNDALKKDLFSFLTAANIGTYSDPVNPTNDEIDAALVAVNFNAYTGIEAKYQAVKYFHESVSYYDVLIRHDANVTASMTLGRYGVVRNNWYTLQLSSVSGPGTPWIPDPTNPTDPSKPTDPDDEVQPNLSVKITVNPWTGWVQDVNLGN